jgi:hypothetical protein
LITGVAFTTDPVPPEAGRSHKENQPEEELESDIFPLWAWTGTVIEDTSIIAVSQTATFFITILPELHEF